MPPLAVEAPDVAATVVTFTDDALAAQLLVLASMKPKGFGTAAETAVPIETFAPLTAVPTPAALLGRRSDDCCDTVACCTGEVEADRSDVAGMRSTLPRASVHFTNVGEMTPFELTAAEAFGSTGLGAMLTGDEAVPVNMIGDGICMTALTVGVPALPFACGNCEVSTSADCVVHESVSAVSVLTPGSIFVSSAEIRGCSVDRAADTAGALSVVLEVSE